MNYKSIQLKNFRNYEETTFEFHDKVNILIGANGNGKTNVLESIYITSYGKSFRTHNDRDLINFEKEICNVKGRFQREITKGQDNEIEISISKDGKRRGSLNGMNFEKFSDIFDNVLAVIFSPEDLKIVKESPDKRRSFIDREMSQMSLAYYRNLINFRKVLQQRNAYLKEEKREKSMLSIWDENLIEYGSKITMQRYFFIKKIEKICKSIHSKLTGNKEEIEVKYSSNILTSDEKKEIFKEIIDPKHEEKAEILKTIRNRTEKVIKEAEESDLKNRYTTKGPQKDDLDIFVNGINIRQFGSQGQQRTAALSIKLSEIELVKEEKGEYPILLLDDVLSELDGGRQAFLLNSLDNVQLFITATEIPASIKEKLPEGKIIEIGQN